MMTSKIKCSLTYLSAFLLCFLFLPSSFVQTQDAPSDKDLVHNAVEDYVLGLYKVEPERIERSIDTTLRKIGYYDYNGEAQNHVPMTYEQLYKLAGKWNMAGNKANAETPYTIDIYDVSDRTASAKLSAAWGIDYMHLSKVDGRWKIMNIMWQTK
ncbi:MAG: nuclear transport factor 2 family protein [Bacteroidota bacterium]